MTTWIRQQTELQTKRSTEPNYLHLERFDQYLVSNRDKCATQITKLCATNVENVGHFQNEASAVC